MCWPIMRMEDSFCRCPLCIGHLGSKLVTFYPRNQGMPTHHALIMLFRARDGRTPGGDGRSPDHRDAHAAVSAAATKLLLGRRLLPATSGSGVQARSHLEAMRWFGIRRRSVWSPHNAPLRAETRLALGGIREDAVRGAMWCLGDGRASVLSGRWLSPGVHVNAVAPKATADRRGSAVGRATALTCTPGDSHRPTAPVAESRPDDHHIAPRTGLRGCRRAHAGVSARRRGVVRTPDPNVVEIPNQPHRLQMAPACTPDPRSPGRGVGEQGACRAAETAACASR